MEYLQIFDEFSMEKSKSDLARSVQLRAVQLATKLAMAYIVTSKL